MKNVYMFFLIGILIGAGVVGIYFNQEKAALQEKYVKLQEDYRKLEGSYTALRENYEKLQANYTELSEVKVFKEILQSPCHVAVEIVFGGELKEVSEDRITLRDEKGREVTLSLSKRLWVYDDRERRDISLSELRAGDLVQVEAVLMERTPPKRMEEIEFYHIILIYRP